VRYLPGVPSVIITEHLDPICAQWLTERADTAAIPFDSPAFAEALPGAEALVVRTYTIVDEALLDRAPKLKVVGRAGVGLDNIDLKACEKRGVRVVYTPDANTQAVVEYVTGLVLDRYRPRTPVTKTTADQFHALRKTEVGQEIAELTFGIWGMGRIGKRIGHVMSAMGMRVIGHDLLPPEAWQAELTFACESADRDTMLRESDIVTIHIDGRPENKQVIGADSFKNLKPNAMLINAARGMLVDHDALNTWLIDHPEALAVLDVHNPEPPAPGSLGSGVLFERPNAILLPHLASRTHVAMENMSWVVKDVLAVLNGQEPRCPAV